MPEPISRAVLTLATGKSIYIQMAVNLARSFAWWHQDSDIRFILATDRKELIPPDLQHIEVIELKPEQYGLGFSPKLYLDQITPAEKTLFLDADCLCFGSLEPVFDRFSGHAVSVVGKLIEQGDFFGDVQTIRDRFQLPAMPYFVGGIYYLEKGEQSRKIFATARNLEPQYDELGLIRLRGRPNEEPLMAIGMAMHGATPITEDGSIKAEPMFYPSGIAVDVFSGRATLWNRSTHSRYCQMWGLTIAHPVIVHFHCSNANRAPYTRECLKLQKVMAEGWHPWLAGVYALIVRSIPQIMMDATKYLLRPLYRKLFGIRPIKVSERIV